MRGQHVVLVQADKCREHEPSMTILQARERQGR